ncbi:MAG: hypothetical protein Q7T18_10905 [Sedimentisphaerales bacterium]|nr:hypothetical protein [Sedimentisphaerales bacterium]
MITRARGFISFLLNNEKGNYLLIGLFALIAHGLLLLNDGVYWDGWLIYVGKFKDRWDLISGIYADRGGLPIYTAFHWVLYQFPYFVFGYKFVAYLFILFSSLFVYRIAALLIGSPQIALFIALISLTYPADQANVELIVIPYLLSYFLFWLGCLFLTIAISKQRRATWWHVGAVVSLLLSFRMYSLLVYFYSFLFLLFLVWWSKKDRKPFIDVVVTYARAYWFFFLLPILFWLGNYWLFPPSGPYVNSDAFIFDASVLPLIQAYFTNGLVGQILASLTNLINPVILGIAVAISLIVATQFKADKATQKWIGLGKAAWVLLFSGAVFFVAGFLPYVVVGRSIGLQGWSTRNAVLIAVPVAMMLSGLVWGIIQYIKKIDKKNAVKTAVFIFSVLIILFTVETVEF